MRRMNIIALIISLIIPMLVGGISAALSAKGMTIYGNMAKPPLSPPAWAFPVAWTALYLMMGLASYFAFVSEAEGKKKLVALVLYCIQLFFNFMWSIIFFNEKAYLMAFIWLIIMLAIVIICAYMFWGIDKRATFLLIPYIVWLCFASYLNMGAYVLNMS